MSRKKLFCTLASGSGSKTNLQLFSLGQACDLLTKLKKFVDETADALEEGEREAKVLEVCVFIVTCLGLSITQLLGQNWRGGEPKVPHTKCLLKLFLQETNVIDEGNKADLERAFSDFIDTYDDCRHFGAPKHDRVATLDLRSTEQYMLLVKDIWNLVIRDRSRDDRELEIESIDDVLNEGWTHVFHWCW